MFSKRVSRRWLLPVALVIAAPRVLADGATDRQDARQALQALGAAVDGATGPCSQCHALDPETLAAWAGTARALALGCLDKPELSARAKVDCLRLDRANPASPFGPKALGLLAAGTQAPAFRALFAAAFGEADGGAAYQDFLGKASMPVASEVRLSAAAFATVEAWVMKGAPFLDELLALPPRVAGCVDGGSPALTQHVEGLEAHGWRAVNAERQMRPFACPSGPESCFSQLRSDGAEAFPLAANVPWARGWVDRSIGATFRIIQADADYRYWLRSSPDGRYVGTRGRIYDLAGQLGGLGSRLSIVVNSSYDPNFFPDGSGFSFLNEAQNPVFCPSSLLADPTVSHLDIEQAPCTTFASMPPYLYLGATVDGADYLAASGTHINNDGESPEDPSGVFSAGAYLDLYRMVNDGRSFQLRDTVSLDTPNEGDWALSPTGTLAVGRWSASGVPNSQAGYRVRQLDPMTSPLRADLVGQVCLRGGKATVSYDERILAVHHFAFPEDFAEFGFQSASAPGFKEMVDAGTANVYLADLKTGRKVRITRLEPGQWALFPHFRSDGWLYFLVKDGRAGRTYIVATDAAIRLRDGFLPARVDVRSP